LLAAETCIKNDIPRQSVPSSRSCLSLGSVADLKLVFSGQCKLIAARVENDVPLDLRSLRNLIRLYRQILAEATR
jgi:hypothetical protein